MSLSHKGPELSGTSLPNKASQKKSSKKTAGRSKSTPPEKKGKREEAGKSQLNSKPESIRATKSTQEKKGSSKSKAIDSARNRLQKGTSVKQAVSSISPIELEKEIRERAFYIYKGQESSQTASQDALSHWLQAENEVKTKYGLLNQADR